MTEDAIVYLGLGSNMGDRQANLDKALDLLSQRLRIKKVSSIYDTEPVGSIDQPHFLNLVCQIKTRLMPAELLAVAKGIESRMGRMGKTGAPRPIDIDILLYDGLTLETPELTLPHPRMTERAFVLVPLVEIAPDTVHPTSGNIARELLKNITEKQGIFKWEND